MKSLRIALALTVCALAAGATSASATSIPNGTVSSAHLFNPTVNLTTSPATYSTMNGATFQTNATGGFSGANGGSGTINGTLSFSNTVGNSIAESLSNYFTFSDGSGGTFQFSVTSVRTDNYQTSSASSSITLYILGTTIDSNLGYNTATPTSLTITANETGSSAWSSSATLAVPPTTATPEPGSLVLLGTGLLGVAGAARRRFIK